MIDVIALALQQRATAAPVIIQIDDLQWATPLLLESLETLTRRLSDSAVLVLTTYRNGDEGISNWPPPLDPALTLHLPLAPLTDAEVRELVLAVAGRPLAEATLRSIATRAGGNPLFVTELARLAAATPDDVEMPELPGSLRALIASQLDRLTADAAGAAGQRRDPRRGRTDRGVAGVRRRDRPGVRPGRSGRARRPRAAGSRRSELDVPQRRGA